MAKRVICALLCVLLTGCAAKDAPAQAPVLPAVPAVPEAPLGDAGLTREVIVPLYLPSQDGQTLLTVEETMRLP